MPTVLDSLNAALHQAFDADVRVYLLGEDVLDPYGGAFKVTRGLSSAYPARVLTTPISEAGITGVAAGMALRGLRPVVEIMFGDFVTLIADQLINHLAKFRWMYNDTVSVPMLIRTPMGGRRGYGPTHSQTLEKLYLGVPGLRILAPCALGDPGELLLQAILNTQDPVLFIENKLLYFSRIQHEASLTEFKLESFPLTGQRAAGLRTQAPCYLLSIRDAPPASLTLATYGYMTELARPAMLRLAYAHEIFVELVAPTQLAPFEMAPILASLARTRRLLTVEEGSLTLGWGAEVVAHAAESLGARLLAAGRVAARELPVPASVSLESAALPGVDEIVRVAREIAAS